MGALRAIFALAAVLGFASNPEAGRPNQAFDIFVGGSGRSIHLYFSEPADHGVFSLDVGHVGVKLTSVDHSGRAFVLAPEGNGLRKSGAPVAGLPGYTDDSTMVDVAFPVPPGVGPDMYSIQIRISGATNKALAIAGSQWPLLVYIPSPDIEQRLSVVRNKYLGRIVYAYPFGTEGLGQDFQPYEWGRITMVKRGGVEATLQKFQSIDGDFTALEPLEIRFGNAVVSVSDAWEIERTFSLTDPRVHPRWPQRLEAAFNAEQIVPGMTHDMVSRLIGYPAAFGTLAQLNAMSVWDYDAPAPFGSTVYFKGDRVVKYDPPGELP